MEGVVTAIRSQDNERELAQYRVMAEEEAAPLTMPDSLTEWRASGGGRGVGKALLLLGLDLLFALFFISQSVQVQDQLDMQDRDQKEENVSQGADGLLGFFILGSVFFGIGFFVILRGFFTLSPNQAMVLQLFGRYRGTVRETGCSWVNPLYQKTSISLRLNVFESKCLKVNDKTGTPIEIAAVVVWRVHDTAQANFYVDNYKRYVEVQSESALRVLASYHPYDVVPLEEHVSLGGAAATSSSSPLQRGSMPLQGVPEEISLRGNSNVVAEELRQELQRRILVAGLEVVEARISHLAYSPEIAHAMLQRQQASAVVSARRRIVEGAVGILKGTLEELHTDLGLKMDRENEVLNLNHVVTNLLTVLVSDQHVQPVISTGR